MKKKLANTASSVGIRILSAISVTIAAILIIYSAYAIYDALYTQSTAFGPATDLFKYKPVITVDDGKTNQSGDPGLIKALVEDYTSWLTIEDTNIDYPVVQGKNDLYYASHDVFKKSSLTGAIYLAADNKPDFTDNYNILYGHHMDNGAMFGDLDKFKVEDFFNTHRAGTLIKDGQSYDVTIFAVFTTDAYDFDIYTPGDRDLPTVLGYIKTLSLLYDDATAEGAEKVLVMSTCMDYVSYGRLLVIGKLTPLKIDDTPVEPIEPDKPPKPIEPPVEEPKTGFAWLLDVLKPTGSHYDASWAVMNLVCLILTAYMLFPLTHLVDKFGRVKKMKKINEEKFNMLKMDHELTPKEQKERDRLIAKLIKDEQSLSPVEETITMFYYNVDKFLKRFIPGLCMEALVVIGTILLFIFTTDMRTPMTLINEWTPFFALLLLINWIIDRLSARYRTWLKRNETIILAYSLPDPDEESEEENDKEEDNSNE